MLIDIYCSCHNLCYLTAVCLYCLLVRYCFYHSLVNKDVQYFSPSDAVNRVFCPCIAVSCIRQRSVCKVCSGMCLYTVYRSPRSVRSLQEKQAWNIQHLTRAGSSSRPKCICRKSSHSSCMLAGPGVASATDGGALQVMHKQWLCGVMVRCGVCCVRASARKSHR